VVLGLESGVPLLIEGKLPYPGAGKVFLFTSTLDRDWNNLPAKPVFLPLMQQLTRYLAQPTLREGLSASFLVGEELRHELSAGELAQSAEITDPQGRKFSVVPVQNRGSSAIEFGPVEIPGIYRLSYLLDGKWRDSFLPVNLDIGSNESDLSKMEAKKMKQIFPRAPIKIIDNVANLEEQISQLLYGKEISRDLTFVLVGLLFFEVFLANPRKKR